MGGQLFRLASFKSMRRFLRRIVRKPQEFDERTGEYTSLIDLSDEAIPRSLSAKAKNYDIRMPDGGIAHLQEGTHITNKQYVSAIELLGTK